MNEKRKTKISKFLSLVLRHKPAEISLKLDKNGWANIAELLEKSADRGNSFTFEDLQEIVATNDKKRFAFDETQTKIRANQGHSLQVEIGFEEKIPPAVLYQARLKKM